MIKYAEVQALRKKATDRRLWYEGYHDGRQPARDSMAIGAPIGSVAGTVASSFLIKDKMSAAKKLAILLAGAGVGAAAGAGVGAAYELVV